ncbi:unnamed protein product [Caenorhabditis auriculariae]|uniref:Uncharacterized protein n=1 Tax=Caenorhabditis auriculariae TaxID=2777116 RepID=A0A8S1HKM8_9PELO|nr:unnamed protein product [Caenorhabditis auriculariae]
MNYLNISDAIQAVCHFLTGLFLAIPWIPENHDSIVRFVGATLNSSYLASYPITCILSASRVLIILKYIQPDEMSIPIKVAIFFGLSYSLANFLCCSIDQNFMLSLPGWSYDMSRPYGPLLEELEVYESLGSLGISYIAHMIILGNIYMNKKQFPSSRSRTSELRIFFQSTILTLYITASLVVWHHIDWFPESNTIIAIIHTSWLLITYLNPVLLLAFNSMINFLNICDLGQAVGHLLTGIFVIFPEFSKENDVYIRLVGSTFNWFYLATFPVVFTLAASRALIISNIVHCTQISYHIKSIYRNRKSTTSSASRKFETAIFIHSTIVTVHLTILIIAWHNLEYFSYSTESLVVTHMMWLALSYLNPILLLSFNSTFRKELLTVLGLQSRFLGYQPRLLTNRMLTFNT